jgi:hypothetical protein
MERKSGMVKNQADMSPPHSPLELIDNIYKNSAGNSIINISSGKKNRAGLSGQFCGYFRPLLAAYRTVL